MQALGLPLTVFRPMAFMELMTDKDFFPPVSMWHLIPKLAGADTRLPWLCTNDLGAIAARAFLEPDRFIGADVKLASDVRSIDECRRLWRQVAGRRPRRFPMPVWMFERFVGPDLTTMWRWLRTADLDLSTEPTREILPGAVTVREWLLQRHSETRRAA